MIYIPEGLKIIEAIGPKSDAAGTTGAYVSLAGVNMAWIMVHITQGNAATIASTIEQATDTAGTSSKAITNVVPIWTILDCAAGSDYTRQTDAVSYTTDAGVKHKIVIFQIDPTSLDTENGFDCIAIITGASHADNVNSAVYLLDQAHKQSV